MPAFLLALGLSWQILQPGAWWNESRMASHGPLASVSVIVVRMDPRRGNCVHRAGASASRIATHAWRWVS
jgi:hypothetical protein